MTGCFFLQKKKPHISLGKINAYKESSYADVSGRVYYHCHRSAMRFKGRLDTQYS